jgi:4a-hydroxytetrahydrobiopterin dehydratase
MPIKYPVFQASTSSPLTWCMSYQQDFMTAVSLQCKIKNHHPEWSNVSAACFVWESTVAKIFLKIYNTTFIRWTTHAPEGLSDKDLDMATICDSIARDFGETDLQETPGELKSLADRTSDSAGDCCVPKSKARAT